MCHSKIEKVIMLKRKQKQNVKNVLLLELIILSNIINRTQIQQI
jgi:hypothetical protein